MDYLWHNQCLDPLNGNNGLSDNDDDTDSEEQKLLELEASLYSKIHYAEDLSYCQKDNENDLGKINSTDIQPSEFRRDSFILSKEVIKVDDADCSSIIENHISPSLYSDILEARKIDPGNLVYGVNEESDSGIS